ncbi:MAG: GGDEF domain-containing protein [Oscillatoriaceae bacterium SKW80]|nr:GGDEF domain-containing protein [Oscillatoriaceae bacterium SKYG93]MCX8120046.1 GGDEF domain-containing protein [Oscillatoriaceae bacterium SKW80]MDW8454050.1 GGDEF domain-containing protein [Oscillatoriaceae cyanobacterium SKYGB_i_bin93]HIK29713.1 GGDEF domain-containing protein [Oscillatoriaceae cyanobacterium M7585_C2015_266]
MLDRLICDLSTAPGLTECLPPLSLESKLRELSLCECDIELSHPGKEIAQKFKENPLLPGVILTEQGELAGMISRRRFFEHLSRPYGLELFWNRPLTCLYRFIRTEILIFSSETLIVDAAHRILYRSAELLYEPIVVEMQPRVYRLLDVHQLLLAQSQIHILVTQLLNQTRQQLESANQELQRLATLDGLTHLANRRRFDEYLNQEWQRLQRSRACLSLILCDIDFFKRYNDACGHLAGDDCLRKIATAIQNAANRSTDLVARYGGEEFAVVLPDTDAKGGIRVAEKIRENVRGLQLPHPHSPVSPYVSISLGVASMVPARDSSPLQLIAAADLALYKAKQEGRDCFFFNGF